MLRQPNYIYHINPDRFNPVCNLTIDPKSHEPIFEFSEEWISDSEVDISDDSLKLKVLNKLKCNKFIRTLYNFMRYTKSRNWYEG